MKKFEFLHELLRRLSPLPEAERDKAYAFYAEMIDDSIEDGMGEEEAVAKLGDMDEIVECIIAEVPMKTVLKSSVKRKSSGSLPVVLLVLGFPVWFPILISILCVLLTLFLVFWIVDLVLWIVLASAAAAAVGGIAGAFHIEGFGAKLMYLGVALFCAGCTPPLYMASLSVTKRFAYLTSQLWKKMKNSLLRKRRYVS